MAEQTVRGRERAGQFHPSPLWPSLRISWWLEALYQAVGCTVDEKMTGRIAWVESRAPRPAVEMRKWISISSLLFLSFRFPFLHRSMKQPTRESCLFTRSAQLHEDPEEESR